MNHETEVTDEAFARLWAEHIGIIMIAARNASLRFHVDMDLMIHAGRLALWRAAQLYDPGMGCSFPTYLVHWLRGKTRALALQEIGGARAIATSSLNEPDMDNPEACPLDRVTDTAQAREFDRHDDLLKVIERLPLPLREAVDLYFFEDLNIEQTGRKLGVCRSRAHQRVQQALKLMRQQIEKEQNQ